MSNVRSHLRNVVFTPFVWVPGAGLELQALDRLRAHVRRPREPMGEAWFMGAKREIFDYLLHGHPSQLDVSLLARPLEEIASGNSCFGPMREWHEWLLFLLAELVDTTVEPRRGRLHELLISAVMSEYWDDRNQGPYRQFRQDVLRTLGLVIMDPSKWQAGKPVLGRVLFGPPDAGTEPWGWWEVSGDLSASLFFCLKYLEPAEIRSWTATVLAVRDPHWRAQLLVWLEGGRTLLETPGQQPKEVFMRDPKIDWESSHVLDGNYTGDHSSSVAVTEFLPAANKAAFRLSLSQLLGESTLLEWKESINEVDYLALEAGHITSSVRDWWSE